jgi:hypothetical protein
MHAKPVKHRHKKGGESSQNSVTPDDFSSGGMEASALCGRFSSASFDITMLVYRSPAAGKTFIYLDKSTSV